MTEENKDELNIEYKFVDHGFKMEYVLRRVEELEREHFGLMIDRLDESHTQYEEWYAAVQEVIRELERVKYIYKQLGGTFGSEIPGMNDG